MQLKTFTYRGVNSASVNLYVLNCGDTYNSPERSVEFKSVYGKNGDVLIDNGNYRTITISYEVILRPLPSRTLAQQIQSVKNFLYKRDDYNYAPLSDEYHDGWRNAVFVGPLDWETSLRLYGKTTLSFIAKPELFNGEGTISNISVPNGETIQVNLSSLISDRKDTDYLNIRKITCVLPDNTGITNNLRFSLTSDVVADKVWLDFGETPITLFGTPTEIVLSGSGRTMASQNSAHESLNQYIVALTGDWFQNMFSKALSPSLILVIANGTGKNITAEIEWERWSV